jgi:hypothetical protein
MFDYWRWINSTYPDFSRGSKVLNTLIPCRSISGQVGENQFWIKLLGCRGKSSWGNGVCICKFWRLASQRTFDMPRYLPPTVSVGACCVFVRAKLEKISHRLYDLMLVCLRFPSWLIKTYPLVWGDPANPEPACIYIYIWMISLSLYIYIYKRGFGGDTIYI